MNKTIIIKPTCCIVDEILYYIESKVNGKTGQLQDRSLVDENQEQHIQVLLTSLDDIEIQHKSLFKWLNHTTTSLASILMKSFGLTMNAMESPTYFDDLVHQINSYHDRQVGTLTLYHHIDFDFDHPCQDLLSGLVQLGLDDHDKLILIDAIYHPSHTIEMIQQAFEPFIKWFKRYEQQIDHHHYVDYFNETKVIHLLTNANIDIDGDITVYPSLVCSSELVINIGQTNQISMIIGLSIDYDALDGYDFITGQIDYRLEQLSKVLSDKSKMKIIDLLKHQRLYGAQIASLMDLKPSTVSYHLDALMNAGMVKATRENNRIYFEYDKEHTLHLLEQLKQRFE